MRIVRLLIIISSLLTVGTVGLLTGCGTFSEKEVRFTGRGQVQAWPKRPWADAFEHRTPHYLIHTNTSRDTAEFIGELMEQAHAGYMEILGHGDDPVPVFIINAYAARKDYEAVARRMGLPVKMTAGLYSPVPPAAIHLPYTRDFRKHPAFSLVHEGVHQFIDQTLRFRVPDTARKNLPPVKHTLLSVPMWLNEGLATYMEGAVEAEGRLAVGRVDQDRLVLLQKMIRRKKCPPLREVLGRPYGQAFWGEDYAVAWGVVYSLRHSANTVDRADRRERLIRYIAACRQGFYADPDTEFMNDFLHRGQLVSDFNRRWAEYVARRSLVFFERIIVGEETTPEAWERNWTDRIRHLDPNDSYGGLDMSARLNTTID